MIKRRILCGIFAVICLISTTLFIHAVIKNAEEKKAFEALDEQVKSRPELVEPLQSEEPADTHEELPEPEILPQYKEPHEQNPDMAGWIEIEGTELSYPVMYTPDDVEYYLKRAFDKTDSAAGTPFIGYDCSLEPRSDNLLLYGHHMKDGTMFTTILSYKDKSFWEEHPVIRFDTLYEIGNYEVMAAFYVTANVGNGHFEFYNFTNAGSAEEFTTFVDTSKEQSLYDTGITAEYGDDLITLSTCSYHSENGRFVVVARKI